MELVEQTVIPSFTGKRECVCKHIFWHMYFEMTGKNLIRERDTLSM